MEPAKMAVVNVFLNTNDKVCCGLSSPFRERPHAQVRLCAVVGDGLGSGVDQHALLLGVSYCVGGDGLPRNHSTVLSTAQRSTVHSTAKRRYTADRQRKMQKTRSSYYLSGMNGERR